MVTPWRMTQKVPALRGCVQATWGLGVRAWGCRARIPEAPGPRQSRPPSPGDLRHPARFLHLIRKVCPGGILPGIQEGGGWWTPSAEPGHAVTATVSALRTQAAPAGKPARGNTERGDFIRIPNSCAPKHVIKRKTSRRPEVFAYPVSDTESAPRKCI